LVTLPADTVWVVLPKSMTFNGGSGSGFESSPQDPTVQTYLARNVAPGRAVEFAVSGTGSFARDDQNGQGDNGGPEAGAPASGPGGGIGAPINTPGPLDQHQFLGVSLKWWLLILMAVVLGFLAVFLLRRPATAGAVAATDKVALPGTAASPFPPAYSAPAAPAARNTAVLNALKEELFALESEKIAGTLTADEYAEQKAALETILKRALKKS
jgi:hypothetical protein